MVTHSPLLYDAGDLCSGTSGEAPDPCSATQPRGQRPSRQGQRSLGTGPDRIGRGSRRRGPPPLLKDPEWSVRRDAASALGYVGAVRAKPDLEQVLNDPHPLVRTGARESLE